MRWNGRWRSKHGTYNWISGIHSVEINDSELNSCLQDNTIPHSNTVETVQMWLMIPVHSWQNIEYFNSRRLQHYSRPWYLHTRWWCQSTMWPLHGKPGFNTRPGSSSLPSNGQFLYLQRAILRRSQQKGLDFYPMQVGDDTVTSCFDSPSCKSLLPKHFRFWPLRKQAYVNFPVVSMFSQPPHPGRTNLSHPCTWTVMLPLSTFYRRHYPSHGSQSPAKRIMFRHGLISINKCCIQILQSWIVYLTLNNEILTL